MHVSKLLNDSGHSVIEFKDKYQIYSILLVMI
jgi:hypothetical protein